MLRNRKKMCTLEYVDMEERQKSWRGHLKSNATVSKTDEKLSCSTPA